eukprot:scaffold651362_cov46-Prasinocladus_malaysianus.AAC.1
MAPSPGPYQHATQGQGYRGRHMSPTLIALIFSSPRVSVDNLLGVSYEFLFNGVPSRAIAMKPCCRSKTPVDLDASG